MAENSGEKKKKSNSALMKPVHPSEDLAKVVGSEPLPRGEITKKLWDYIKAHNLQEPSNKQLINADDVLRPIFDGRDQVSMFEMAKLVTKHVKA